MRNRICFVLFYWIWLYTCVGTWDAGLWRFTDSANSSSRFPDFRKSDGNSIVELVSTPTKITGVHYVQVRYSFRLWVIVAVSFLYYLWNIFVLGCSFLYCSFVFIFPLHVLSDYFLSKKGFYDYGKLNC